MRIKGKLFYTASWPYFCLVLGIAMAMIIHLMNARLRHIIHVMRIFAREIKTSGPFQIIQLLSAKCSLKIYLSCELDLVVLEA